MAWLALGMLPNAAKWMRLLFPELLTISKSSVRFKKNKGLHEKRGRRGRGGGRGKGGIIGAEQRGNDKYIFTSSCMCLQLGIIAECVEEMCCQAW